MKKRSSRERISANWRTSNAIEAERLSRRGQEIFRALETMRKPSVAAINGFALGGGLELAMCCTIRIASPNAKLGQPEVKLGIVPGYGATQRLPRLVGRGRALELLLSGESIDAAEAHRIGLVNAIAPQSELIAAAKQWAAKVIANGPLAVALTMESVDAGQRRLARRPAFRVDGVRVDRRIRRPPRRNQSFSRKAKSGIHRPK